MKTCTRILIVALALVFVSMGAHFETSPESADHPHMIRSSQELEKSMKGNYRIGDLSKRLRTKHGTRNFKSYLANEQLFKKKQESQHNFKQFQYKNNLGQVIFNGEQYNVLIINQSTVLTISASANRMLVLNLVNTASKTNFTNIYSQFQVDHFRIALKLFDEKTVAIFSYNFFLVVNINDLTLRQRIPIYEVAYRDFNYFIDNSVKNEIIAGLGSIKYYALSFNPSSNKYENLTQYYKPVNELYRVNTKEGFAFWNYYKIPVNLTSQFKIISKSYQAVPLKSVSVASNSEHIVVAGYNSPIEVPFIFSSFNKTSYEFDDLYTVSLPEDFVIDPRKVRFTHDDKHFFFNMKNTQLNYRAVGVVKVGTGKVTYFDMEGENMTDFTCFDYGILSDSQFVLVCQLLKKNERLQAQNQYQLWLYNMSNFKLLDTYSVLAEATDLEIKTNPSFNSAFILQIFDAQNKPNLKIYQVVNNKITSGSIPSNFTNFRIAAECLNYLVGVFGDEPFHSFVNTKDFTVIKKTPIYDIGQKYNSSDFVSGIKDYMVQSNILAICNQKQSYGKCRMYEFYDLSKLGMPGDAQFLCFFFVDPSTSFGFFLSKAKLVFQDQPNQIHKINGYDLQKCPTKKLIPFQIKRDSDERVQVSLYKPNNISNEQTCNLIYLLVSTNKILVVEDCEPYKLVSQTIIPRKMMDGFESQAQNIYFSSNYKYLIVKIYHINSTSTWNYFYQLEVRPLNDLSRSLHKTALQKSQLIHGTPDVTEKNQVIYATNLGLNLEKMNVADQSQAEKPINREKTQTFEKMKQNSIK